MKAREARITAIDFEGTGAVAPYPDEPWQIGIVPLDAGTVVEAEAFESVLHVGHRPFSPHAPGRHAALRAEIEAAPRPVDLWPELRLRLTGTVLCAHNTSTEKRYLSQAFPMRRFGPWVDTLHVTRAAFPGLRSHRLEDLTHALGLDARLKVLCPGREAHDALYDAMAAALVLEHVLQTPEWAEVSLEALILARPV